MRKLRLSPPGFLQIDNLRLASHFVLSLMQINFPVLARFIGVLLLTVFNSKREVKKFNKSSKMPPVRTVIWPFRHRRHFSTIAESLFLFYISLWPVQSANFGAYNPRTAPARPATVSAPDLQINHSKSGQLIMKPKSGQLIMKPPHNHGPTFCKFLFFLRKLARRSLILFQPICIYYFR